ATPLSSGSCCRPSSFHARPAPRRAAAADPLPHRPISWKRFIDNGLRSVVLFGRKNHPKWRRKKASNDQGPGMSGSGSKQLRSWMFVPGNGERFIQKAFASSADGIFLDIEDGVLPVEKAEARRMIAQALREPAAGPLRYVRVNALSTPWLKPDLEAVIQPGL